MDIFSLFYIIFQPKLLILSVYYTYIRSYIWIFENIVTKGELGQKINQIFPFDTKFFQLSSVIINLYIERFSVFCLDGFRVVCCKFVECGKGLMSAFKDYKTFVMSIINKNLTWLDLVQSRVWSMVGSYQRS